MKTLYFETQMGAAGDMLTASLVELFDDRSSIVDELNCLGLPNVTFSLEESIKCSIKGSHMSVKVYGVEVDQTIPSMLYGDERKITQIITNLMTNAIKYTEKGSVKLSIKGAEDDIGYKLYLSVSDTGKGNYAYS